MKRFALVASVVVATLMLASPSGAQDIDGDKLAKSLRLNQLQIYRISLSFEKRQIQDRINAVDDLEKHYRRLVKIAPLLKDKKAKTDAETLLGRMEEFASLLEIFAPKHYGKEVRPVVFGQINGRPLPEKPTDLQKRLIKAGKNSFDDLVKEVSKVANEDKKLMEKELSALNVKIVDTDKEIKKLEKK